MKQQPAVPAALPGSAISRSPQPRHRRAVRGLGAFPPLPSSRRRSRAAPATLPDRGPELRERRLIPPAPGAVSGPPPGTRPQQEPRTPAAARRRPDPPPAAGSGASPAGARPNPHPPHTHPAAAALPGLGHVLRHFVALVEAHGHGVADRHACGESAVSPAADGRGFTAPAPAPALTCRPPMAPHRKEAEPAERWDSASSGRPGGAGGALRRVIVAGGGWRGWTGTATATQRGSRRTLSPMSRPKAKQ